MRSSTVYEMFDKITQMFLYQPKLLVTKIITLFDVFFTKSECRKKIKIDNQKYSTHDLCGVDCGQVRPNNGYNFVNHIYYPHFLNVYFDIVVCKWCNNIFDLLSK